MKALTKKVGPLPIWAYAAILGGALLAVRLLKGGGQQDGSVQMIPTGAPSIDPSAGFLNELSERLDRIESGPITPPPPASSAPPDGTIQPWQKLADFGTYIRGLRVANPSLYSAWVKLTGWVQKPGETDAARTTRLQAEYAWYTANTLPAISAKPVVPVTQPTMPIDFSELGRRQ